MQDPKENNGVVTEHRGAYFSDDAASIGAILLSAKSGDMRLYWLVDPTTDVVVGAKYFTYSGPSSIALGEEISMFVTGRDVMVSINGLMAMNDHIKAIANELLSMYPRLKSSFSVKVSSNEPVEQTTNSELDTMWLNAAEKSQLEIIERVLDLKVRPGLGQDGGGLKVIGIRDGRFLSVEYQGACGGCPSSTGSTLAFIERTLRSLVYKGISVQPTAK